MENDANNPSNQSLVPGLRQAVEARPRSPQGQARAASRQSDISGLRGTYTPDMPPVIHDMSIDNRSGQSPRKRRSAQRESKDMENSNYLRNDVSETDPALETQTQRSDLHKRMLLATSVGGLRKTSDGSMEGPGFGLLGPRVKMRVPADNGAGNPIPRAFEAIRRKRNTEKSVLEQVVELGGSRATHSSVVHTYPETKEGALEKIPGHGPRAFRRMGFVTDRKNEDDHRHRSISGSLQPKSTISTVQSANFNPSMVENIGAMYSIGVSVLSPRVFAAAVIDLAYTDSASNRRATSSKGVKGGPETQLRHTATLAHLRNALENRPSVVDVVSLYRPRDPASRIATQNILSAMSTAYFHISSRMCKLMPDLGKQEGIDALFRAAEAGFASGELFAPLNAVAPENSHVILDGLLPPAGVFDAAATQIKSLRKQLCPRTTPNAFPVIFAGLLPLTNQLGLQQMNVTRSVSVSSQTSTTFQALASRLRIDVDSAELPLHWFDDVEFERHEPEVWSTTKPSIRTTLLPQHMEYVLQKNPDCVMNGGVTIRDAMKTPEYLSRNSYDTQGPLAYIPIFVNSVWYWRAAVIVAFSRVSQTYLAVLLPPTSNEQTSKDSSAFARVSHYDIPNMIWCFTEDSVQETAIQQTWQTRSGLPTQSPHETSLADFAMDDPIASASVMPPSVQFVPRLNLYFASEAWQLFFTRRFVAMKRRELAKSRARYCMLLPQIEYNCTSLNSVRQKAILRQAIGPISRRTFQQQTERISEVGGNAHSSNVDTKIRKNRPYNRIMLGHESALRDLMEEVRNEHNLAMKHASYQYELLEQKTYEMHRSHRLPPTRLPVGAPLQGLVESEASELRELAFDAPARALDEQLTRQWEPIWPAMFRLSSAYESAFQHRLFIDPRLPLKFRHDTPTETEIQEDRDRIRKRMRKHLMAAYRVDDENVNSSKTSDDVLTNINLYEIVPQEEEQSKSKDTKEEQQSRVGRMLVDLQSSDDFTLPCTLRDWMGRQKDSIDHLAHDLKDEWRTKFVSDTYDSLHTRYNMYMRDTELYQRHPLRPMLDRARLMMSNHLRSLAHNSIDALVSSITSASEIRPLTDLISQTFNGNALFHGQQAKLDKFFKLAQVLIPFAAGLNSRYHYEFSDLGGNTDLTTINSVVQDKLDKVIMACSSHSAAISISSNNSQIMAPSDENLFEEATVPYAEYPLPNLDPQEVHRNLMSSNKAAECTSTGDMGDTRDDVWKSYAAMTIHRHPCISQRPPLFVVRLNIECLSNIPAECRLQTDRLHPALEAAMEWDATNLRDDSLPKKSKSDKSLSSVYPLHSKVLVHPLMPIQSGRDIMERSADNASGKRRKHRTTARTSNAYRSASGLSSNFGPELKDKDVLPPGTHVFSRPSITLGKDPLKETNAYYVRASPSASAIEQSLLHILNCIAESSNALDAPDTSVLTLLPLEEKKLLCVQPCDITPMAAKLASSYRESLRGVAADVLKIESELREIIDRYTDAQKEYDDHHAFETSSMSGKDDSSPNDDHAVARDPQGSPRTRLNTDASVTTIIKRLEDLAPAQIEKQVLHEICQKEITNMVNRARKCDPGSQSTQIRLDCAGAVIRALVSADSVRPTQLANAYNRYAWLMSVSPRNITRSILIERTYSVFDRWDSMAGQQDGTEADSNASSAHRAAGSGVNAARQRKSHSDTRNQPAETRGKMHSILADDADAWSIEEVDSSLEENCEDIYHDGSSVIFKAALRSHKISEATPVLRDSSGRRYVRYNVRNDGYVRNSLMVQEQRRQRFKETLQEQTGMLNSLLDDEAEELEIKYSRRRTKRRVTDEQKELERYWGAGQGALRASDDEVWYGLIAVDCTHVKKQLHRRSKELVQALSGLVVQDCERVCERIRRCYSQLRVEVSEIPKDASSLERQRNMLDNLDELVEELDVVARETLQRLEDLRKFDIRPPARTVSAVWSARGLQGDVYNAAMKAHAHLESLSVKLVAKLEREKEAFTQELSQWPDKVVEFQTKGADVIDLDDRQQVERIAEEAMAFQDKIEAGIRTVADFNNRERVFGQPSGEFDQLQVVANEFEPFFKLWSNVAEFDGSRERWLTGSFKELDAKSIANQVSTWSAEATSLLTRMKRLEFETPIEIARSLKGKLVDFQEIIPVIESLANPAMKEQHWADVSEILGVAGPEGAHILDPDEGLTLQDLLDHGIREQIAPVQQIAHVATKQFALEKSLESMLHEWSDFKFQLMPYKNTSVYIVKDVEDVNSLLDEQLVKTQNMLASPYAAHVERQCKSWEAKLLDATTLIDVWMSVQRNWLYLEPIFGSEDIMRQMPNEGRKFAVVDASWRRTMATIAQNPRVMDVIDQAGLMQALEAADRKLDEIQKGLDAYLELKRQAFPRFYFLSNDELLEILAETKDPRKVQPHLSKSFEGINNLVFSSENTAKESSTESLNDNSLKDDDQVMIVGMRSAQGERIDFLETIYPNEGNRKGNVELWMSDVEIAMRAAIRDCVDRALNDWRNISSSASVSQSSMRAEWLLKWPGQVVLAVDQIVWTYGVEKALQSADKNKLKVYHQLLVDDLLAVVALIRGKLNSLQRTTLTALTTIDVHARDVVSQLLSASVANKEDFEWTAQLRYYWQTTSTDREPLEVRIINSSVKYGFEYLGNSDRLVITPLTDRCYRTLIGAIHLLYGGAPEGPAGTGKTETTKDLAKAVGIQCVVFNCSDGLDFRAMAKFFKGLLASGAWSCFDEFNRIDLEVLSVIAQQILTITKAKREKISRLFFEGTTLALKPTCNVFITMNPGYAGRSELPDNLKALFRPCAMMVPDYSMIAEIVLYSYGFNDARTMASKIVQVLRLASEQLSSQHHYDYGMRAVKAILVAAGLLKRKLEWNEPELILKAIEDVNLPKFTRADIPLFRGIVGDLFPSVDAPNEESMAIDRAILESATSLHLQYTQYFKQKVYELRETTRVRHGLMLVGKTVSGKSSTLKTLSKALTSLSRIRERYLSSFEIADAQTTEERDVNQPTNISSSDLTPEQCETACAITDDEDIQEVLTKYINPKAVDLSELYGKFDENTHEWTDGILAIAVRSFARSHSPMYKWLVFDGPVDAIWIENMNTVLDDNKKLCLMSGEIIKLSNSMRMIFEVGDLSQASPATVSRCGMVYFEPHALGHGVLVESWYDGIPAQLDAAKHVIQQLVTTLVEPVLTHTLDKCNLTIQQSAQTMILSFLRVLDVMIRKLFASAFDQSDGTEGGQISMDDRLNGVCINHLPNAAVFALIWSIGAATDEAGRRQFDHYVRQLIGQVHFDVEDKHIQLAEVVKLPDETSGVASVFDVFPLFGVIETASPTWLIPSVTKSDNRQATSTRLKVNGMRWLPWMSLVDSTASKEKALKPHVIQAGTKFDEILVPTPETVQQQACIHLLLNAGRHVLLAGETGSGKSVGMQEVLSRIDPAKYIQIHLQFSAQTSSEKTQSTIDERLRKRRAGVFGPSMGRSAVIFIDDLNMPAKEKYGAQPPIELLRQWMDYSGWYDRYDRGKPFKKLVDLQFMAAMGPPGGGRTEISERYIRHFNTISCIPFSQASLQRIFSSILTWIVDGKAANIERQEESGNKSSYSGSMNVRKIVPQAVECVIHIYKTLQTELRPTPARSHYTFNLRDISALFAGASTTDAHQLQSPDDIARLLGHECHRVFGDRLINHTDRDWFHRTLSDNFEDYLRLKWENVNQKFFADVVKQRQEELQDETHLMELQQEMTQAQNALSEFEEQAKRRATQWEPSPEEKEENPKPHRRKRKHAKIILRAEDSEKLEIFRKRFEDSKNTFLAAKKNYTRRTQRFCVTSDFESSKHIIKPSSTSTAADGEADNSVIFCNFCRPDAEGSVDVSQQVYEQCQADSVLHTSLSIFLKQYNDDVPSSRRMDLILFKTARNHVANIARRLSQTAGHALLLGVGGSGRRSYARLAAYTQHCAIYEPTTSQQYGMSEWREDVKHVLMMSGLEGRRTMFLLTDSQLSNDSQWEDVNNILNTGEVPNIFNAEDSQRILSELQPAALEDFQRSWALKQGAHASETENQQLNGSSNNAVDENKTDMPNLTSADIMAYFVKCVRRNLRMVVVMSPVGGRFRQRLRMFPALVNCCYIDWFMAWPQSALQTVATNILRESDANRLLCESEVSEQASTNVIMPLVDRVADVCVVMHTSIQHLCEDLLKNYSLHNYVTPTSYLMLLKQFVTLLNEKRTELDEKMSKYSVGVKSIVDAEEVVASLKQEAIKLQPVLEASRAETAEVLKDIEAQQLQADETKDQMKTEEAMCAEQAQQAQKMKAECESDLAEALPALEQAIQALKNLKKSDIVEVKSMQKPPQMVKTVLETVCIMLKVKPDRVPDSSGRGKANDYWGPAKKHLLSDPKFVKRLLKFDKDHIAASVLSQLAPYLSRDDFNPQTVQQSSAAAAGLCGWVRAIVKYNSVSKNIEPKRRALREAEEKFQNAQEALKEKEAQLEQVTKQLAKLMEQLEEVKQRKDDLERQMQQCTDRLDRANILVDSLGGQKIGWRQKCEDLQNQSSALVANTLLAAGYVSYLGPFPLSLRNCAAAKWESACEKNQLVLSTRENSEGRELSFDLETLIGDPVVVRQWTANALPSDKFSIQNAIMLEASPQWPLLVDPQGQATRWVRAQAAANEAAKMVNDSASTINGFSAGNAGASGVVGRLRAARGVNTSQNKQHSNMIGNLRVLRPGTPGFYRAIEGAVQYGHHILIEEVTEQIDAYLDPLLLLDTVQQGNSRVVTLGENTVEYHPSFRLYLATSMAHPHYSPEIRAKINLLNFTATPSGLEDQMLGIVVTKENPELENQRQILIQETANNANELQQTEDKVLEMLSEVQGNLLDDQALIDTLAQSKKISDKAKQQLEAAEETSHKLQSTRTQYTCVARRAVTLYFLISELHSIDPMYQFSLKWFIRLFELALGRTTTSKRKLVDRLQGLVATFTQLLYSNVCRSLFEKDKLLFSMLLTLRVLQTESDISTPLISYLLSGNLSMKSKRMHPLKNEGVDDERWLSDSTWIQLDGLYDTASSSLKALLDVFMKFPKYFKDIAKSDNPGTELSWRVAQLLHPSLQRASDTSDFSMGLTDEESRMHPLQQVFPRNNGKTELGGLRIEVGPLSFKMSSYLDASYHQKSRRDKLQNKFGGSSEESTSRAHESVTPLEISEEIKNALRSATMLDHFVFLRFLRPDKTVDMLRDIVSETLGHQFVEPPSLLMDSVFEDSTSETPLLFILSSGADPMELLQNFAETKSFSRRINIISLGQGQGPVAEAAIQEAMEKGNWVCLQNCHLAISWLPSLERICSSISAGTVHADFRLWLTSMPTNLFPVSVLQSSIKMTYEPPKGLRASLLQSFSKLEDDWFESCSQPAECRRLAFGLCFLHATALERRKFGSLGWNIPYEFSESDLSISLHQTHMFLDEAKRAAIDQRNAVPFNALQYLIAECNYGGRVTDGKDRLCLTALVKRLFCTQTLENDFNATNDTLYQVPDVISKDALLEYAQKLPLSESPDLFGLHFNADIAAALAENRYIMSSALLLRVHDTAAENALDIDRDEQNETTTSGLNPMLHIVVDMLQKIPLAFDIDDVMSRYPVRHDECMNTVLCQEIVRFNRLLSGVRRSLSDLRDAQHGLVVMSSELEVVADSISRGTLPSSWAQLSYPSMKPLGSWTKDLCARIEFFSDWVAEGPPDSYWISGFYFTQAFLTGTLQNYARKYQIPIDTIKFSFDILNKYSHSNNESIDPPSDGAFVHGLFLDGAAWSSTQHALVDQAPQQLIETMPIIWLLPQIEDASRPHGVKDHYFACPVYKTAARRGTLSTTGHSTNFVLDILLPMTPEDQAEKWIQRGAALICSTSE